MWNELAQAIPIPDLEGQPTAIVLLVVLASVMFAGYALVKQIQTSRLSELDTVVDRVTKENDRLEERAEKAEALADERTAKMTAIAEDLARCLRARDSDRVELERLRALAKGNR